MPRTEIISQAKYARIVEVIYSMRNSGHSPEVVIINACRCVGIKPPEMFEAVELVVDPNLDIEREQWK